MTTPDFSPEARKAMAAGGDAFVARYSAGPFGLVAGMEDPLVGIERIARAIHVFTIADDIWTDERDAMAVQGLLDALEGYRKQLEKVHSELFRLMHPDRDHFEKVGWPGDEAQEAAP
jgi:hypothetical protein